ncbi:MAG: hypothetical protein IJ568_04405 [Bacilli bacterium]|nr:hypothetical protein [Bacilli bacterium]
MKNNNEYPQDFNSLTGNEFLDFLSWCEIVGIDFEGNKEKDNEENNNYSQEKILSKNMKGRDKYE